eukprot:635743-Pleurochrysis_carterae.AAC.1
MCGEGERGQAKGSRAAKLQRRGRGIFTDTCGGAASSLGVSVGVCTCDQANKKTIRRISREKCNKVSTAHLDVDSADFAKRLPRLFGLDQASGLGGGTVPEAIA